MKAVIQYIEKELAGIYPATEIQGITRLVLENVFQLNYTQLVLRKDDPILSQEKKQIEKMVGRLKNHEPIQYVLGKTEFYGLKLNVNPSVLIPRPETEELVHWIIETKLPASPRIVDIGTGSGCIALALKKNMEDAAVSAVDISAKAIQTAEMNAASSQLEIDFIQADILNWQKYDWDCFDLVVSNPPYVREMEKDKMQRNVLEYEPQMALFVPDDDPLVFYRKIAGFAKQYLHKSGWLFFEINKNLSREMTLLLQNLGFRNIQVKIDINGKNRMIRCAR
jgi:release factor glutamine methyltransferase